VVEHSVTDEKLGNLLAGLEIPGVFY